MSITYLYRILRDRLDENRGIIILGELLENHDPNIAIMLFEKAQVLTGDPTLTRFRLALCKNIV